jgi:hypothetical protein
MKKFLALSVLLGATVLFVPSAEAKTGSEAANINSATELNASFAPQRWRNRRARVVTRTRIVRVGYRTYREVIQTRYFPNGRVVTRVLSRTRIR